MEILGLLDTLESIVLDSFKIPMTKKTVIDEQSVLAIIDKIRLVAQSGDNFAKRALAGQAPEKEKQITMQEPIVDQTDSTIEEQKLEGVAKKIMESPVDDQEAKEKAVEIIQQAYQIAREIRAGADQYADEVLANMELTSSRVLRTVQNGRDRINKILDVAGGVEKTEKITEETKQVAETTQDFAALH